MPSWNSDGVSMETAVEDRLEQLGRSVLQTAGSGGALWPHGTVRSGGRGAWRPDHAASRAGHGGAAVPAGDEPRPSGEVGLPAQLPASLGLRLRASWRGGRNPCGGRAVQCRAGLADALKATDLVLTPAACYPLYPLAALARRGAGYGPQVRRRVLLFPPRDEFRGRPAAGLPDARICVHGFSRRGGRFSYPLAGARKGIGGPARPAPSDCAGERSVFRAARRV